MAGSITQSQDAASTERQDTNGCAAWVGDSKYLGEKKLDGFGRKRAMNGNGREACRVILPRG